MKQNTLTLFASALLACAPLTAQVSATETLINAARSGAPEFATLLEKQFGKIEKRGVATVWGQDYLFAADSPDAVSVAIDDQSPVAMKQLAGSTLWYTVLKMRAGVTHSYQFHAAGKPLYGRGDVTGYNPDSYPRTGVAQGKVSDKIVITSKIYDGMTANFWFYASPGVDPATPAPVMVWQDGQNLIDRENSRMRLFTVTENLVHQKLIPPMVHVMIQPGTSPEGRALRSVEYDTVSDRYTRFVLTEVLPIVEKTYKLRQDGYSRAIGGESSGGICSFTAAWFLPNEFARVHSTIGSFTSIQWRPDDKLDGGNIYPFSVRKQPKRNIRVWLSDGADDLENTHGSWPLQNIQLANSLKMREYDFHFRFGAAAHNSSQAALDLPESLAWLWRGYDPSKTSETFEMDPAERAKPYYRVGIVNREAW